MRLLILNQNYPHPDNIVGDVFVHVRAKAYAKHHQVQIFCWYGDPFEMEYEGMPLKRFADEQSLLNAIQEYKPDRNSGIQAGSHSDTLLPTVDA
jgi:L-malate glycosyltransferase